MTTLIVKLQLAELSAPSVAVQVTVVEPMGKIVPDGGEHNTAGVEQLSVADGVE